MRRGYLVKLAALALDVSNAAPLRANKYASAARVSWALVREIRAALSGGCIDWRAHHRQAEEERRKRERTRREAELIAQIHARRSLGGGS